MMKTAKTPMKANVSSAPDNPYIYSIAKKYYKHARKHLTEHEVNAIFNAGEKAYYQRTELNRFFTIHYDDYADRKHPQAFITNIMDKTRKWLQYRGLPVAYLYVIENSKTKGIHAHILIHIPAHNQIPYKKALKAWLPINSPKTIVNVQPIKYPLYGDLSPLNCIYGRLRYICKGIDPKVKAKGIRPRNQGIIIGKRWGISKSLQA
jgi:hypothetical protein